MGGVHLLEDNYGICVTKKNLTVLVLQIWIIRKPGYTVKFGVYYYTLIINLTLYASVFFLEYHHQIKICSPISLLSHSN